MKILVTGGTGFIGYHVVELLLEKGHSITILGRKNNKKLPSGVVFALADLQDYESVSEAVSKVDAVIHLAAQNGSECSSFPDELLITTNIIGSLNIFDACRYFKKTCVYGSLGNHSNQSLYAITKSTTERFALMYNKEHGTRIIITRIFNTFGERPELNLNENLISSIILAAIENKPIKMLDGSAQKYDFIYVKDVAEMLLSAIENDEINPMDLWHIGTTKCSNILDIVYLILKLTGSKSIIDSTLEKKLEGNFSGQCADPSKLIVPDYQFTAIEDGLLSTLKNLNQEQSYLNISNFR